MKQAALTIEHLTTGYRSGRREPTIVGRDINAELHAGEVTCLLGANGTGKSTLLRTVCGLQPPIEGRVTIAGDDLARLKASEVARRISVVHTGSTNAGALTVEELVGLGRQPYTGFFGRLDSHDRAIVGESLESVGIADMRHRYVATLSDGERQKAMIARALAQHTPVMLLDEPTTFLDVASRLEVMNLMRELARRYATAVLLSTHEVTEALNVADRLWLMRADGLMESGSAEQLIADGAMERLFADRHVTFDPQSMTYRLGV